MRLSLFQGNRSDMALAAISTFIAAGLPASLQADDNRRPDVPQDIQVSEDNKVHFHGFALGFQIYTWDGSSWGAAVPDAVLYDNDGNDESPPDALSHHTTGPGAGARFPAPG